VAEALIINKAKLQHGDNPLTERKDLEKRQEGMEGIKERELRGFKSTSVTSSPNKYTRDACGPSITHCASSASPASHTSASTGWPATARCSACTPERPSPSPPPPRAACRHIGRHPHQPARRLSHRARNSQRTAHQCTLENSRKDAPAAGAALPGRAPGTRRAGPARSCGRSLRHRHRRR
jgi:hypothetical protein